MADPTSGPHLPTGPEPAKAKPASTFSSVEIVEKLSTAVKEKDAALNQATFEGAENFTDNYYLISILDELAPLAAQTKYTGWTSLRQNESGRNPSYLKSYFSGWDEFLQLRPEQASALQPYFRLSLVQRDKNGARWSEVTREVEVVLQGTFAGSLDSAAALSEQYNEPVIGLKSFNWRRTTGTGDPGKKAQTIAQLVFFGNNLSIFTRHPYNKLLARTEPGYGLKVVVGWGVSDRASGELLPPKLRNALKNARETIYLNTTKNDFDFQQDGTFKVTLSCVGSTMDFLKDFDILGSLATKSNLINISKDINKQISQANKLKESGDASELGRTPSSQTSPGDSVNLGGNDSLNQHLETIRTSIDKVLESRDDMTEEEKASYKREALSKMESELAKKYNGSAATSENTSDLASLYKKHIVQSQIDAQRQRTQENMSRIQRLLYKNNAIRYVKVAKEDFQGFAGNTLGAMRGKKEFNKAVIESIEREIQLVDKLYGQYEYDSSGNVVRLTKEGVDTTDTGGFFSDGNEDFLKLTSADGKPTNAEDALKSYGLAYDGDEDTREQFLQKLDAEKKELVRLESADPNSRQATEKRILILYAEKRYYQESARADEGFTGFFDDKGGTNDDSEWNKQLGKIKQQRMAQLIKRKEEAAANLATLDKSISDGSRLPTPSVKGVAGAPGEGVGVEVVGDKIVTQIDPNDPETTKNHYISYFFLGDLINALYEMARLDNRNVEMPYILLGSMVYEKYDSNTQVSSESSDPNPNVIPQRKMIEMAQIPISVKRFNAFFHKYYVQELVHKLPIIPFLRKVFEVLVRPIFSGEAFGRKLMKPTFDHINFNSGEMRKSSYQEMLSVPRANMNELKNDIFFKPESNVSIKGYLMVTANLVHQSNGNFNYFKDRELNIPHYYMGADRGVLKNISFSAVQNQFDQTDRVIKANKPGASNTLEVLQTPYNVNLITIGNPLFALGTSFFLMPSMPGKGNAQAARELGLGGYYRVISTEASLQDGGTFETNIFAINENNQYNSSFSKVGNETSIQETTTETKTRKVQ